MHFGDKEQKKAQKLLVTIYKDIDQDKNIYISVESIVEARYISTNTICKLHYNIEHILKDIIDKLEDDVFYLIDLKTNGWTFTVKSYKKLTSKMIIKNPLLGLH